jgi:hypothetical protein
LRRQEGFEKLIDAGVLKKLTNYKGCSALKKAALNILVKMLKPKELE